MRREDNEEREEKAPLHASTHGLPKITDIPVPAVMRADSRWSANFSDSEESINNFNVNGIEKELDHETGVWCLETRNSTSL